MTDQQAAPTAGEKIYDDVIAPRLLELAKLCHEAGLNLFAVVEYAPGSVGMTFDHGELLSCGPQFRLIGWAARSRGNADVLIDALLKDAKAIGGLENTNSFHLKRIAQRMAEYD